MPAGVPDLVESAGIRAEKPKKENKKIKILKEFVPNAFSPYFTRVCATLPKQ